MRFQKRRFQALVGLAVFACLVTGLQALPSAAAHLGQHRQWINSVRAGMRGALFTGMDGVVLQKRSNDCGAACLKMALSYHGIEISLPDLVLQLEMNARGTSMLSLRVVANRLGLPARSWMISDMDLRAVPFPIIAFIRDAHFVLIRGFVAPDVLEVDDPALGRLQWPVRSFRKWWRGEALVFDPEWSPPDYLSTLDCASAVNNNTNQKGARANEDYQ